MSPLAALAAALLAGAAPFVAEQPEVRAGNERLLSGDPTGALERYQAAEQAAGPRPEIDYDRGGALHAQQRHAEAAEAWRRAAEADRSGRLASRALQNRGNALDASGDREGALRAFSEALARDPSNEDARYNLEVLLRRKPSGKGQPKEDGDEERKRPEGPKAQGQGQARPEPQPRAQGQSPEPKAGEGPKDPKSEPRRAAEEERRDDGKQGQAGRAGERSPRDEGQRGERADARSKQDAERLLDALRARERNMPLQPIRKKDARPRETARDW